MNPKEHGKAYAHAVETLRAREGTLVAAIRRRDEIAGKETEARLAVAQNERDSEKLADGSGPVDQFAAESAKLAQQRVGQVAMVDQLERLAIRSETEVALGKVNVVAAEVDVIEVQRAYFGESLSAQLDEFWSANKDRLQRMLNTVHAVGTFGEMPRKSFNEARQFSIGRLADLIEITLAPALSARSDADPTFGLQFETERGMPAPTPVQSTAITDSERRAIVPQLLARLPLDAIAAQLVDRDHKARPIAPAGGAYNAVAMVQRLEGEIGRLEADLAQHHTVLANTPTDDLRPDRRKDITTFIGDTEKRLTAVRQDLATWRARADDDAAGRDEAA